MEPIVIVLIIALIALFLLLHIIFGILCYNIARDKGRSGKGAFWLGFFLGLIGLFIMMVKPPKTIALNPTLQQNLMHLTWLWRCGALTTKEFEREKSVLYWLNYRL